MIIANPEPLDRFARRHPEAREPLQMWKDSVLSEIWSDPHDAIALHPNARHLGRNRLIFNIRGNRYRIITLVDYSMTSVFIRFVGTHAQYDRINAREV